MCTPYLRKKFPCVFFLYLHPIYSLYSARYISVRGWGWVRCVLTTPYPSPRKHSECLHQVFVHCVEFWLSVDLRDIFVRF